MNSAVQKYLDAASGLTNLTKNRAERIVKQLVRQGEAAGDQVGDLVEELLGRQRRNRELLTQMVKSETKRAVRAMGLATNVEVERLQKQVADLKREVTRAAGSTSDAGAAPAKKAARKSSAKKTARKTSARKSPAKKTARKAVTGKKATRTAPKKAATKTSGDGNGGAGGDA